MFEEDLTAYFDDFGEDVVFLDENETIRAIFDHEYIEAFEHASRQPVLTMADQYPKIKQLSLFIIRGLKYEVVNVEPDGTGMLKVQLQKICK